MKSKQLLSLFLAASVLPLASCEQETTSSSPSQSPSDTGSSQTTPSETPSESDSTPEPAVDYSISQITAKDQSYTVRGVIDAKTTKGFVITDGAASVYVYLEAEPSSYALGDYVEVSGKTGAFNGMFQFTKEAKITKLTETPSFTIPEPATLTMATAASWQSKTSFAVTEFKEYKWRSTAGETGGFKTLNLAGSEVTIEPSYMPSEFNIEVGATYDVTAYFAGYAGEKFGNYAAVYLTSLSKVDGGDTPTPDPDPEPSDDYSISQITTAGTYTVRGVIDAITTEGFVVTDGTAAVYYHDKYYANDYGDDVVLGASVELSGEVSAYNGLYQYDYNDTLQFLNEDLDVTIPSATPLTAEIANGWNAPSHPVTAMKEYSWTATAGKSGNFPTLNISGSNVTIEPTYIPASFNVQVGKTYDITAYFAGYSTQYKYAGVYLTSLTESDGDTPDPDPEPSDDYSISQITETGTYTIRGVVDAMTSAGCVISDGINAIYYHDYDVADLVSLNDYIEITGDVMKHYGMFQFRYGSKITVLDEEPNITIPSPTPLTAEIVTGWTAATDYSIEAFKKYSWTSTAGTTISGDKTYDTLNIDGSNILIEPSYLLSTFDIVTGETYNVTAYFGGYSTEHSYAAMYVTDLVLAD